MTRRSQIILGVVLSPLLFVLALFFLASGISHFLGEWLQASPSRRMTDKSEAVAAPAVPADAIVEREPSDWPTQYPTRDDGLKKQDSSQNPLDAAPCDHVTVTIVSDYEDDRFSLVTLQTDDNHVQRVARIGDVTGDWTLVGIAQHPRTLSPTVWFMGDDLCQAELFQPPRRAVSKNSRQPASRKEKSQPKTPAFASHVKQLGPNEFEVDRAAAEEILADPSRFMSGVQAVPQSRAGEGSGISLRRLSASSPLAALGLKSGDLLTTLNGSSLADPEKMLMAYARLRTAERLRLEIVRGGTNQTIDVQIH